MHRLCVVLQMKIQIHTNVVCEVKFSGFCTSIWQLNIIYGRFAAILFSFCLRFPFLLAFKWLGLSTYSIVWKFIYLSFKFCSRKKSHSNLHCILIFNIHCQMHQRGCIMHIHNSETRTKHFWRLNKGKC